MQTCLLQWATEDRGLHFEVTDENGTALPITQWGAVRIDAGGRPGSAAPLLTLIEDGLIEPRQGTSLSVPFERVAAWDHIQISQLGLPPVAPFRLNIQGQGVLSNPGFRFRFQLQNKAGVPAMGTKRTGTLLRVGLQTYSLLAPLYSLIEGMERFNATPEKDVDARFAEWDRLQSMLPEDATVDRHLKSLNIARADALTLDPRDGDQFDPVMLHHLLLSADAIERGEIVEPTELLPPAGQNSFAARFRRSGRAQRRYALAGNWFVMLPEGLQEVLGVVREMQDAAPEQRRAFLADPHAQIKERLGERLDAEAVDALFQETPAFLSARVECLGEWSPKLHAFVAESSTDWLPPDEDGGDSPDKLREGRIGEPATLGVSTSNGLVKVAADDIPDIIGRLREGREQGATSVDWQGQQIPTDADTEAAFERVQRGAQTAEKPAPVVPIIKDNIESLDFLGERRSTRGQPGGLPSVLESKLFAHQQAGLDWLQAHWVAGSPGALLADDMGLGKTVQTLAFLTWVQERVASGTPRKPHLIVAPTGLLKNWEAEANLHLSEPGMGRLLRAYGKELKGLSQRGGIERRGFLRDQIDWVLTTYETLRDKIKLFVDVPWRVVVFDEVQKIKNPAARTTDMAKSLDAELTLALTGTPVENSLSDLWCIIDAVQPGLLGSHNEFRETYAKPAEQNPAVLESLKAKLDVGEADPPALLRRMKQDHIDDLPKKHVHVEPRPMPVAQADAYDQVVGTARSKSGEAGAVLEALHHLRRVSLLPDEVGPDGITDDLVDRSARMTALVEILDKIAEAGEKSLIFLESLKIQEALIPYLRQRYGLPADPLRIYGGTQGAKRKQHVDRFQASAIGEFDLMLLSPKAAGVGLTLTAANHVIHLSRWWNPAVEDQCTDRVYRIGQHRDVHVHIPVAVHPRHEEHSFDYNLHRLLEQKRALSLSVLTVAEPTPGDLERLVAESL